MSAAYLRTALVVAALLPGAHATAAGQSPAPWEIEFHGGGVTATSSADGTGVLPVPGPTAPGGNRPVPSWYFGDGAAQLNQWVALRGAARIFPLNPMLQRPFIERQSGGSIGFRVARALSRRFGAEFTLDYSLGTLVLTGEAASSLEAARASFVTALDGTLAGGLIATRTVTSDLAMSDRQGRQLLAAGTLLVNLAPSARLAPYVAVGAGTVSNRDIPPSAELTGAYQFTLVVPGSPALRQTDTVTVRASVDDGLLWVFGGGVKYPITDRWGVRADVRDHLHSDTTRTLLSASPTSMPLTAGFGVLSLFGALNPPLVFSGVSTIPSTLSGALTSFETFTRTGVDHHVNLTAGLFWRF